MRFFAATPAVLLSAVITWQPLPRDAGVPDPAFRTFLASFEVGLDRFVNGDPIIWKQNVSRRDEATILGGWGGYEKGGQVEGRYDWAAAQFGESGATVKVEYLTTVVSADLAYTVSIERSQARIGNRETPRPMALRVTHIFQKEKGAWKLLHRHADHLVAKVVPGDAPGR